MTASVKPRTSVNGPAPGAGPHPRQDGPESREGTGDLTASAPGRRFCDCAFALLALWQLAWMVRWGGAQLWFDEVITLNNYCGAFSAKATLWSVFRNYSLANNHILSSAVYWCWLKLCPPESFELWLRLPSIAFGMATTAAAYWGWRRFLGCRLALFASALLAASPVFLPFAYQIRGYALSMLLSALAMPPMMAVMRHGGTAPRQLALFFLLAPQALIMPSGAILAAAVAAAILLAHPKRWVGAIPAALGGAAGLSYYLTLWTQFRAAALDAGSISRDWWTCAGSARHVAAAFAIHAAAALAILGWAMARRRQWQWRKWKAPLSMFLGMALAESAMYLAAGSQRVPFPRNSLIMLPFFTLAVVSAMRCARIRLLANWQCGAALLAAVLCGLAVITASVRRERQLVAAGDIPQNLLMQQYRGDCSMRDFAGNLASAGIGRQCLLLVSDNDGAVAKWYFKCRRLPAENVFDRTDALQLTPPLRWHFPARGRWPLFIGARLYPEAVQLANIAGYEGAGEELMATSHRQFRQAR